MPKPSRNALLRDAYELAGFSQHTLAAAIGVSQPAIWGFANYTTIPSVETVRKILEALGRTKPETIGYLIVSVDGDDRVVELPVAQAILRSFVEVVAP